MAKAIDTPLIRLNSVSRIFLMGEVKIQALRGIDLDIDRGSFCVIVGPSGSGKSTLLNIIGGMDSPTSGEVWFEDRNLTRLDEEQLCAYRRDTVGFLFQFYNLVPTLTALENVSVAAELSSHPRDPAEVLTQVGLGDRFDHFPSQLSGGEQQRVSVARAIVGRPKLLLCDEPTGALDFRTGRLVLELLARLNHEEALTMMIITHNAAIGKMADHIVHLGSGQIAESIHQVERAAISEISW